jgi:hypothetical protein
LIVLCALTPLRHVSFSEGKPIMPAGVVHVNE